jgi:16S rRNA (cytosine1402-N4)-methyltransferase
MHVPVMLREALEYLALKPGGVYMDATAGLGGHTGAIAKEVAAGLVLACDRDAESLELARANTQEFASRIRFIRSCFRSWGRRWQPRGFHNWTDCWRI